MCESFFVTLECELLDRRRFKTQSEARMAVFEFIEGLCDVHGENVAKLTGSSGGGSPYPGTKLDSRTDKQELRAPAPRSSERTMGGEGMKRFAGIDIGSERHVVAVVDEHGAVVGKPSPFGEEAA